MRRNIFSPEKSRDRLDDTRTTSKSKRRRIVTRNSSRNDFGSQNTR